MVDAALRDGTAHRESLFEAFARRLPDGRRYGIVAGTGRLLELIDRFRFEDAELEWLRDERGRAARHARLARRLPLPRRHLGLPRGRGVLPRLAAAHDPGHVRRGGHARDHRAVDAQLRLVGRQRRRAHGVGRARPAHRRDGLAPHERARRDRRGARGLHRRVRRDLEPRGRPHLGHPHDGHRRARVHPAARFRGGGVPRAGRRVRPKTTLLIDTYDIAQGVEPAVRVAGTALGAVRIDSGDLPTVVASVREQLDGLGAVDTRITVTSDLDEFTIAGLSAAPVDSYGVGTAVVTGSGFPAAGMVYKLVARRDDAGEWVAVAKASTQKASVGGRKNAARRLDSTRTAREELVFVGDGPRGRGRVRARRPAATAHGAAHGRRRRRSRVPRPRGHRRRARTAPRPCRSCRSRRSASDAASR